jgi:hypothetical protein
MEVSCKLHGPTRPDPARPGRFISMDRTSGTRWLGGWMGSRTGLAVVKKGNLLPCRESVPRSFTGSLCAKATELSRLISPAYSD